MNESDKITCCDQTESYDSDDPGDHSPTPLRGFSLRTSL